MPTTLFLGGARSGKSRLAQTAAEAHPDCGPGPLVYLATGEAGDDEMAERIARHRADRGPRWHTVECPIELPRAIADAGATVVLVDCLTLWLSNLMLGDHDVVAAGDALVAAMADARGALFLVSNEVGLGLVPGTRLGRTFRDAAGRLNQQVAAAATHVVFVTASLALQLK